MVQVVNAVAPFTSNYIAQSLEKCLPRASAAGIISLFDAGMQVMTAETSFQLYMELEKQGKLPFRVVGTYYHNNPATDPVPLIQDFRRRFRSELVQASVLKLNIDGGDPQHTAALLDP